MRNQYVYKIMETDHKIHGRKFQNGSISDFCNADLDNWNYDGRNSGLYHQTYERDMQLSDLICAGIYAGLVFGLFGGGCFLWNHRNHLYKQ